MTHPIPLRHTSQVRTIIADGEVEASPQLFLVGAAWPAHAYARPLVLARQTIHRRLELNGEGVGIPLHLTPLFTLLLFTLLLFLLFLLLLFLLFLFLLFLLSLLSLLSLLLLT